MKANLQNIKSVLRKANRKRRGGRPKKVVETAPAVAVTQPVTVLFTARSNEFMDAETGSALEQLEVGIDDCMGLARAIDAEALRDVVALLRRARNAVVWMQGQ